MKPTPLPPEPSNSDLARGHQELHGCVEALRTETERGFEAAQTGRDVISADLKTKFLTLEGQLRALSDQHATSTDALEAKLEHNRNRIDATNDSVNLRLDAFGSSLLAIGMRVGAGKPGELKRMTWWKTALAVMGGVTGSAAFYTLLLKLLPVIPVLNAALLKKG